VKGGWLHRQFLCCQLDQRRFDTLAQLRLAGEDGDDAIGINPNPRIEPRRHGKAAPRRWLRTGAAGALGKSPPWLQ
jgi:hypothetical protein